jgi:hypothetical protein
MAVVIDDPLAASPATTPLPSGPIELSQMLHSDLGGETAEITYSLDGRINVQFQTPAGPSKTVVLPGVDIPGNATRRSDTVVLEEIGGGTSMAQVEIRQVIVAETTARDSVVLTIEE